MSDDLAQGPHPTPPHAGVLAPADQAGQVRGAVGAEHALGPAVGRGAIVAGGTAAHAQAPRLAVVAVGTAEVVATRISALWAYWLSFYPCKLFY